MLDAPLPFVAEEIETQAVALQIRELQQLRTKRDPLVVGQQTFKHGVLHALAVVQAGFGDVAQAAPPFSGCGGDIVADKNHHGRGACLTPLEGRVGVEIAAEVARKEQGLRVEEEAEGKFFCEEGVLDFVLFAFLPGGEDFLAAVVGEEHGTRLAVRK